MHLRKTRKAKAAASEFVKRVISGKDVSPDRRGFSSTSSKSSKPSTSKQSTKGNASSKSPGRGRPCSPRVAPRPSAAATTRKSNSRSPSRAPEPKTKKQAQTAKQETSATDNPPARRGRPRKYPRPESPAKTVNKTTIGQGAKSSAIKQEDEKPKEPKPEKVVEKKKQPKSNQSSPVTKVVSSSKGKSTQGLSVKRSSAAATARASPAKSDAVVTPSKDNSESKDEDSEQLSKPTKEDSDKSTPSMETKPAEEGTKSPVITPRIVFVDPKGQNTVVVSPSSSPTASPSSPQVAKIRASPPAFRSVSPIKISPMAKLIPVSSLPNISTAGRNLFTISFAGSALPQTVGQGQSAQFIVSAQPVGCTTASPIKVTTTATGSSPGHITLDLAQLAKSLTPPKITPVEMPAVKQEPESPSPPIINKSPKFLLSSSKHSKNEPVSEGKIRKRKRSKVPAWDMPSAVYKSSFPVPQPKFSRVDDDINYPENANMEQSDYFTIMGIINKADIKKIDGSEHRNHRLAGGKLRRVCKPKISPEMVYRRFSLARGCIMHDVFVDSDEENGDGSHSPRVADKNAIIRTEQSKKGSLSPKIHDSYRQHCIKIPVITIEKVSKDGSSSESESTPSKLKKINRLKENEPPYGSKKGDWECGEGSSGMTKQKKKDHSKKSMQSPKGKAKTGAKKQLDMRPAGGKTLSKSKSFEVTGKKCAKPSSMAKSKSFDRIPATQATADEGKMKLLVPKIETEEDDSSKRRSERNRGSKRKQWWHLLRANPDEFEEDKEWDKEVAQQEEKRKARMERAQEKGDEESEVEEVVEEEPQKKDQEKEPQKKLKKKSKIKKEPDSAGEGVDTKSYTDLYESKLKNKKKRSKDWALAKKVLEEAQAQAKQKDDTEEGVSDKPKKGKKEGTKRKATDSPRDDALSKKIKTEPPSAPNSDEEGTGDKNGDKKTKLKKKKSIGTIVEIEEPVDEKPEIITNLIILGEDGEPLEAKGNTNLYDQLQTLLEGRDSEKLARTGVLELSIPPNSPQSFIEILAREQQRLKRRPQSPFGMLPIVRSDVLYKTKERECITPHMCSVCWINDHMYCRNMKRIARDLPLCGGCIHYVPCKHFMQKESPSAIDRKHMQRRLNRNLYATIDHAESGGGKTVVKLSETFATPSAAAARTMNFTAEDGERQQPAGTGSNELLLCDEILTESDSEPTSPEAPPPPGTELLKAEIRARARQIKRSLGFKSLPQTISPLKRQLQWTSPRRGVDPVEIPSDDEEEDNEQEEVVIAEYAGQETVGHCTDVDYGVPLTAEYMVKGLEGKKQCWSTGTSIFMPNTESDASNDSFDIPPELLNNTATEHAYEESVFGENSQDSTETSLSQISTHAESDDSADDALIGEPAVSRPEEKKRKKKKKTAADVIRVKSIGGEPLPEVSFEGLKNKWQLSDDGTQVLTFTTKEIRERKPELLSYIKRAGLINVITEKLNTEKASIKKLVKENETVMRQSQDKLEQHRCLMAAVLTEILSVKEQLRDLQTALKDEESICTKLRIESKAVNNQSTMAEAKVKILKKIMNEAIDRGLLIEETAAQTVPAAHEEVEEMLVEETKTLDGGHRVGPGGDTLESMVVDNASGLHNVCTEGEQAQDIVVEALHERYGSHHSGDVSAVEDVTPVETAVSGTDHVTVETVMAQKSPSPQGFIGSESQGSSESFDQPGQTVITANAPPACHAEELESSQQLLTSVQIEEEQPGAQEEVVTGEIQPSELLSRESTPGSSVEQDNQMVSVSIEGGHSLPHSVMLELPKELLQCQPAAPADLGHLAAVAASLTNVEVGQSEGIVEMDAGMHNVQMVGDLEDVIVESGTMVEENQDLAGHTIQVVQDTVGVDQTQAAATQIVHGLMQQQALQMTTHHQTELMQLPGVATRSPTIATTTVSQPGTVEAALKPVGTDFDNIIMRPGELGDVIMQAGDLGALSFQQGDMGGLVVQQGDLAQTVDTIGLNTFLTSQGQLDEGMLVQQEVGDNYILQQQPAGMVQEQQVFLQAANSDTLFVQASDATQLQQQQQATGANVFVQQQQVQQQQVQQQQVQQQDTLQNIILQTDNSQNVFIQEPTVMEDDTTGNNLVLQQGQDIVLQNLDLVHGFGQVQTIMINGQPYQVILQSAEPT